MALGGHQETGEHQRDGSQHSARAGHRGEPDGQRASTTARTSRSAACMFRFTGCLLDRLRRTGQAPPAATLLVAWPACTGTRVGSDSAANVDTTTSQPPLL